MSYQLFSTFKHLTRVSALAVVMTASVAAWPVEAEEAAIAPPVFLQQSLPGATLSGTGRMRFFGLRIYDARLWTGPQFESAGFETYPLALELTYHRAFTGAAIAQRSLDEIERQGELTPQQADLWLRALTALLPDVQQRERLTGLYQPGQGMRLWNGQQAIGAIEDAELARRFVGIWLSPGTSEPGLRRALLGRESGEEP